MERPLRSDIGGDDFLDALLTGFLDAVVVTNSVGEIVRASSSVHGLLGWSPEELIGQNVRVIVPEPHRSQHDDYLARYRETGKSWIMGTIREFDVVRKDGALIRCELSLSKVKLPGHKSDHYCGAIRGIADRVEARRRLQLSEAKFRAVFDNENELVLLLDEGGRILEANRRTYQLTGCQPVDVVGRLLDDARIWTSNSGNRERIARLMSKAYERGVATARADIDVLGQRFDSKVEPGTFGGDAAFVLRPHEVSVRLVDEVAEGLPRAIVELRDVTDLVRAEQRETAIIRSLARVGEEAAVLAHELRSPVSELEMALRAVSKLLGEEEGAVVAELTRRMRRLERLLNRTLSFSRPLDLDLQPQSLEHAFARALDAESGLIKRHKIRTAVHVDADAAFILADAAAFEDLMTNLLRNAVEAQPEGGRVELSAVPGPSGFVAIAVEDDGPGIAPERRDDVFRVFSTDKEGGTGFGLALVRKITEAHGATVELAGGIGTSGLVVRLHWPIGSVRDQ